MLLLNRSKLAHILLAMLISIHLMLLLNECLLNPVSDSLINFNTSYVVIKPICTIHFSHIIQHFNTSYVVIKHLKHAKKTANVVISIHLMLLLNRQEHDLQ